MSGLRGRRVVAAWSPPPRDHRGRVGTEHGSSAATRRTDSRVAASNLGQFRRGDHGIALRQDLAAFCLVVERTLVTLGVAVQRAVVVAAPGNTSPLYGTPVETGQ